MTTIEREPEYLFYVGATFTVEWYRNEVGRMPAKEYYEQLFEMEQRRLDKLVRFIADNPIGTRLPRTLYNLEDAEHKIYAFKPDEHRFFNFMVMGRKVIIVAAYRKHSQRMQKKDLRLLETVIAAKRSYLARLEKGVYYEGIA